MNGGFVLIHIALLTISVTFTHPLTMEYRYLVPMYMPLLFTAILFIDRIPGRCEPGRLRKVLGDRTGLWARAGTAGGLVYKVGLCLWVVLLAHGSLSKALAAASGPADTWSLRYWQESRVLEYLRRQNPDGRIFSNTVPVMRMFHFQDRAESQLQNRLLPSSQRQLQQQLRKGDHVVWFHEAHKGHVRKYGLSDMRGLPELETVGEFADGVVFQVKEANHGGGGDAGKNAFVALGKPVIRSHFDLHLKDGELIYAKVPCIRTDVQTRFFLHAHPLNINDPAFPEDRRRHGFDNLDFNFDRWGTLREGACFVARRLPSYGIARIVTGQYVSGQGRVWSAGFAPNSPASAKAVAHHSPPLALLPGG